MDITQTTVGSTYECPGFHCIRQQQIQDFANATGDHQWIHLDADKCKTLSPYKTTIAHGFLTLSLMPKMFSECIAVNPRTTTMINYGMDSLRFIEAVRVNDSVKYVFTLLNVEEKETGHLYKFEAKVLIEGRRKPALIGSFLSLVLSSN